MKKKQEIIDRETKEKQQLIQGKLEATAKLMIENGIAPEAEDWDMAYDLNITFTTKAGQLRTGQYQSQKQSRIGGKIFTTLLFDDGEPREEQVVLAQHEPWNIACLENFRSTPEDLQAAELGRVNSKNRKKATLEWELKKRSEEHELEKKDRSIEFKKQLEKLQQDADEERQKTIMRETEEVRRAAERLLNAGLPVDEGTQIHIRDHGLATYVRPGTEQGMHILRMRSTGEEKNIALTYKGKRKVLKGHNWKVLGIIEEEVPWWYVEDENQPGDPARWRYPESVRDRLEKAYLKYSSGTELASHEPSFWRNLASGEGPVPCTVKFTKANAKRAMAHGTELSSENSGEKRKRKVWRKVSLEPDRRFEEALEYRATKNVHPPAETAQAKFKAFYQRMGTNSSIHGLEATPLSSLCKAVAFITGPGAPPQANLTAGCKQAEARADQLLAEGPDEHGLTRDEIAAINLYTQQLMYKPLNRALWSKERGAVKPYWGYIRLLQHALFKVPKCDDAAIYRGIRQPYEPITEAGMLAKATQSGGSGEPEIWWGFSSCSTDLQATKAFLGQSGVRVLYTIEGGSSARDVRKYSAFAHEAEVLMPFGSAFTVVTAMQTEAPTAANNQASFLLVTLRQTHDFALPGQADPMEPEPEPM
eukprot:SAG25_NODE_1514_length_2862_cov_1.655085_3_plen_647_part_00